MAGTGPTPMTSGSTPTNENDTRRIRTGRPSSVGGLLGGEEARGRAVVEPGGVARGDVAVRAERRLELAEVLDGRAGTRRLVGGGQAPALLGVTRRDGDEVALDLAVGVRLRELVLAADGEGVGALLRQLREAVVEVLGGLAHDERVGVDDLLGRRCAGWGRRPRPWGGGPCARRRRRWRCRRRRRRSSSRCWSRRSSRRRTSGRRSSRASCSAGPRAAPPCGRGSGPGRRSGWSRRWRPPRPCPWAGSGCGAAARGCTG